MSLCIIIPVHKPHLSPEDAAALQACAKHLKAYDTFLVFPKGMHTLAYLKIHPALKLQPVPPQWLASVADYNRMKMQPEFYQLFRDYKYMMTYELDAYIFSDQIALHKGYAYDFIGAPVFEGYLEAKTGAGFLPMLNSGFSIRNIHSCLKVLPLLKKFQARWRLQKLLVSNFRFLQKHFLQTQLQLILNEHLKGYFRGTYFHEDVIWTAIVPKLFPFFKVAPPTDAMQFSFEVNAAELLDMNHGQLPLGCHAWTKFPKFWKDYIPAAANLLKT
ncbi:hypothetical protein LX64_00811 [Chitinophaga skermanii]|uniref:DUF5672 domain-containing protein n=1 Tax=Chitinophaga skermanii TaxID=331697 RepID=A0A327R5F6_9BACT|nr:DUF5672 family protein [Chitinophaga skermanii]RAJ11202.1 hypothetical protein LX64_00811 [Chitinophaga skermanii]